jgi:hypothetical protein
MMFKQLSAATLAIALFAALAPAAHAADGADCEKQAADKKLAGAAKNSFVKKCSGGAKSEAAMACDKQAAEKKLAGAAKNSFTKKCVADAAKG